MPRPEISAVLLCYRAEEHLAPLLEALYGQLRESGVGFEIVLVANYYSDSDDRTPRIAEELARSKPEVRCIAREKEGAMGWDMRSGLRRGRGRDT